MSRSAAALAALALVAGCAAVGPDYRAPSPESLAVPSSWRGPGVGGAPAAVEASSWWRGLGDPVMASLVEQSLASSPTVHVAEARLRESRARRDLAGANRFPTVTASASARRTRTSGASGDSRSLFDAGFDAAWEPDVFGGKRRALEAAEADLEAAQADLYATHVSLAAEVGLNYVEVRSFQARLAIARANLETQLQTLQLTRWRAEAGLTTSLDVEQARAAAEQTRAQIPTLETALSEARHRIAILAGRAPGELDAQLAAGGAIPQVPAALAVGIPADTLRQRPDLRAAERRLAAETARIGQQAAAIYPDLSLSGSIGAEALTVRGLTGGDALASTLVARIAGTIFDAGRVRRQVEIQTAVQERALHAYEAAVLTALEDVENALVALENSQRRRAALAEAVEAARNAALYAEQRYSAGITDFQTVLDTQRTLLSVEDNFKGTEAERASALIRLYKALGGGWSAAPAAPAS